MLERFGSSSMDALEEKVQSSVFMLAADDEDFDDEGFDEVDLDEDEDEDDDVDFDDDDLDDDDDDLDDLDDEDDFDDEDDEDDDEETNWAGSLYSGTLGRYIMRLWWIGGAFSMLLPCTGPVAQVVRAHA